MLPKLLKLEVYETELSSNKKKIGAHVRISIFNYILRRPMWRMNAIDYFVTNTFHGS